MASGSLRQNALRRFLGFVPPKCAPRLPLVWCSSFFMKPSSIVPGERAPGRLGDLIRGGEAPTSAGAERRTRWPDLTIGPVPPAGGNGQPMTRAGAPFGASPRRFSFPRDASGNGRSRSLGLLDPAGLSPCVHPLHQPVTDGPTKLGRAVTPRPPGAPADEAELAGIASLPRSGGTTYGTLSGGTHQERTG